MELVQKQLYSLQKLDIELDDIVELLDSTILQEEPSLPFPQADSFRRIINLCELLYEKDLTKDDITSTYDFDKRQTDYYLNAGKYLGLIIETESDETASMLSKTGRNLFRLNNRERQLEIVKLILQHTAFNKTVLLYIKKAEEPTRDEVVEIMRSSELFKVQSDSTYRRRASTVLSWTRWILDLIST